MGVPRPRRVLVGMLEHEELVAELRAEALGAPVRGRVLLAGEVARPVRRRDVEDVGVPGVQRTGEELVRRAGVAGSDHLSRRDAGYGKREMSGDVRGGRATEPAAAP